MAWIRRQRPNAAEIVAAMWAATSSEAAAAVLARCETKAELVEVAIAAGMTWVSSHDRKDRIASMIVDHLAGHRLNFEAIGDGDSHQPEAGTGPGESADDFLRRTFEFERCDECGGDVDGHDAVRMHLGAYGDGGWRTICRNPPDGVHCPNCGTAYDGGNPCRPCAEEVRLMSTAQGMNAWDAATVQADQRRVRTPAPDCSRCGQPYRRDRTHYDADGSCITDLYCDGCRMQSAEYGSWDVPELCPDCGDLPGFTDDCPDCQAHWCVTRDCNRPRSAAQVPWCTVCLARLQGDRPSEMACVACRAPLRDAMCSNPECGASPDYRHGQGVRDEATQHPNRPVQCPDCEGAGCSACDRGRVPAWTIGQPLSTTPDGDAHTYEQMQGQLEAFAADGDRLAIDALMLATTAESLDAVAVRHRLDSTTRAALNRISSAATEASQQMQTIAPAAREAGETLQRQQGALHEAHTVQPEAAEQEFLRA